MTAAELKASILDLAIRGKLVPQDSSDEPAAELLKRIKAEKAKLIAAKKIKKEKTMAPIADDEKPFEIPESWVWVRLSDVSSVISKGTTPSGGKNAYVSNGINFIRAESIGSDGWISHEGIKRINEQEHKGPLSRSILEANDVLVTIAGTLGRIGIVRDIDLPANTNQAVCFVRSLRVDVQYARLALLAPELQKLMVGQKKVTGVPNLTIEIVANMVIPLPPYAEQKRIVAKIEELMPLVERYGKAEERRLKLNASLPTDLEKSILQEAIQGKLVPKKGEWKMVKLGEVCEVFSDGDWIESKDQSNSGFRLVQTGNIGEMCFCSKESRAKYVSKETFKKLNCTEIFPGDILVSRLPDPVGRACIVPDIQERMITAVDCTIVRFKSLVIPEYFIVYSGSSTYYNQVNQALSGTTRKRISRGNLAKIDIPLPPLEEQKAIVAKVEELLAAIKNLKG